jgi:hypothetical protein
MIPSKNSYDFMPNTASERVEDYRVPECCGRRMVTLTPFDIELLVGYYCPQCNKFEPGRNPKIKKFLA